MDESLQQLEKMHTDLCDISDESTVFSERVMMTFFLNGLPKEFEPTVDALITGGIPD